MAQWRASADPAVADKLSSCVAELTTLVVEHLDDEERNAVPIIENHLTSDEWQAALKRGAAFLSSHPRLGIVLGGLVLDYAAPDECRKFLAGVRARFLMIGSRSELFDLSPTHLWSVESTLVEIFLG